MASDNFRSGDRLVGTPVQNGAGSISWLQHVLSVDASGDPVDVAAIADAIGTTADAAWSGTGDGTVIAILKAIAINTTPP